MQIYLTSEQAREADDNTMNSGVSSETLMLRAGRAIADEVRGAFLRLKAKSVLIVCGTGNNGGDGYVAARELINDGISVCVYAFNGELSAGCRRERDRYMGEYTQTVGGDIIVDCIFGTGLNRALQGEYAAVVKKINASGAYVISADLPSGLNGENGAVLGAAVKADKTVALGNLKLGCALGDGIDYCGEAVVKDIGIISDGNAVRAFEDGDIAAFYGARRRNTHKGDYGSACIVAGSGEYLGAPVLSVSSALRSGCGYVYAVVPSQLKTALATAYPQCILRDTAHLQASAIAVGMGMGCTRETYAAVCSLLNSYAGKLIIDADGLNALAKYGKDALKQTRAKVLITPHIGEMSRLCGLSKQEILANPVAVAQNFAKEYNITVHLKNAVSVTSDGKTATLTVRGTSALAKAGSGDLLSGLLCGNAARGLNLYDAAVCSQYVLGMSAEICSEEGYDGCVTSADLINNLHTAINRLTRV